jgi:hypothetical protein
MPLMDCVLMSRRRPSMPTKLQRNAPRPVWHGRLWPALAVAGVLAGGCTTAQVDQIPQNIGGLPQGAPARPAVQADYPAVHDMPPQRAQPLLDEEEQKRLENDLLKVRNRQAPASAKTPPKSQNTGQTQRP